MKLSLHLLGVALLACGPGPAVAQMPCPVAGDLSDWQADFCMARTGTDDITAARPCLEHEAQIRFRSECNAKLGYKQRMCQLAVRAKSYSGSYKGCVKDPLFKGATVSHGGA